MAVYIFANVIVLVAFFFIVVGMDKYIVVVVMNVKFVTALASL